MPNPFMSKPLKPLLIVFGILIFAGIFALSWNQWLRPAGDIVADGASSGAGPGAEPSAGPGADTTSQSAETGSGQATSADSGTTGQAPAQSAESAASAQSGAAEDQTASSAAGGQPAADATQAGADGAAAEADKVAALTPDAGAGSTESVAPAGEAGAATDATNAPEATNAPAATEAPAATNAPEAPDATDATNAPDVPGTAAQPSFDIVRVEPSGDTVVAGRAAPGAAVELLSNGSVIATTTASTAGDFVLVLEKPLGAGGHDLALRTSGGEGVSIYSRNNVAVAVPEEPSGEVLVVLNKPGAASEILAKPGEVASAEMGTEVAAMGETVIAVAPSAGTQSGETQIAAAPVAPVAPTMDGTSGQETMPAAQPQAAEPATTSEPETPPQMAETAPAMPEPPAQMAEAPAVVPQTEPQPAQPQMAATATGEKPAEGPGGEVADQVADAGQAAVKVASAAPIPLGVEAVEVEGGKLYAAGTANPGEIIRVYIDDEPAGETKAFDNGRWLVETEAKMQAGTVTVRADQLAPGTMNVVARAEVPFTKQLDMAVLIPTAKSGAPAGATAQGELPNPNAVIIRRGDNLWTISRRTYGSGIRYTTIYTANKDQIRDPDMIFPGQIFMLPVGEKSWTQ